jgi:hypothetical protein
MHPRWAETWLEIFGPQLRPEILIAENDGSPVGCCILTRRVQSRAGVPIRRVYLNTDGEPAEDEVSVEYNELLAAPEFRAAFVSALTRRVRQLGTDQLLFSGVFSRDTLDLFRAEWPDAEYQTRTAPFVNLEYIREQQKGYEQQLSSNTRGQVRRSRKMMELESGPIHLERAASGPQAHAFLLELAELHQSRWIAKQLPGAFSSKRFSAFHHLLIERLFASNSVDLLRIRAGDRTLGVLYNLVGDGKVYFYQSGFQQTADNRQKPGLVCHVAAIDYYGSAGFREYDFLAGDSQYKDSLANARRELHWVTFTDPTLRMRVARHAKTARSWVRRVSAATATLLHSQRVS